MALDTARLLTKHGAFSESASASLLRSLALSSLSECATTDQVNRLWAQLTPAEAQDPELARAAANHWLGFGGEPGHALHWLMPQWVRWAQLGEPLPATERVALTQVLERALAALPPDAEWLQRIDQAAQQWPNQAELHYLAACVCMRHGLWGKAQQSLDRCAARLANPELSRRANVRLAELAEQRGDQAQAARHWKNAAQSQG
jgi:HemY protein